MDEEWEGVTAFREENKAMGLGLRVTRPFARNETVANGKHGIYFEVYAYLDIGLQFGPHTCEKKEMRLNCKAVELYRS